MQASRVLLLHIIGLTVLPVWAAQVNVYPGDNIQLAINQNPAGSTFILNPGIYRLASPLIPLARDSFIGASPCAPPTTSCTAILSGATEIGSLAIFDGQNYEVGGQSQHGTIGTNACEAGYSGCIYPEALFFDGVPYQHLIGATEPSIASGQWWFDYAHQIIYFHDNPAGHLVETSITPAAFAGNANGVTIQYLEIEEFANTQQTGTISTGSPSTTSGIDWVITNNDIRLNSYWGVKINYGWQVLTNYVYMNGDEGIGGGCSLGSGASIPDSGILIEGNTVTYNNFAGVSPGFGAGGIKLGRCRGVVLRNNIVQHNNGEGIHCDVSCEFPLMDGNTVTDNDGNGLQMEIGGTGINAGAIFRNNILQRNGLGTLSGTPGFNLISQASSNVQAYCNVVEVSSTGQNDAMAIVAGARGSNPFPPGGLYSSSGNYFYRNTVIWDGSSSSNYNGATQFDTTNQPTFFTSNTGFDYNGYHLPNINTGSFRWDGNDTGDNTPKTFAQLQLVGQEPHGTVDTNFTSGFPSISITSPPDGSQVAGGTPVAVSASDTNGISRVEFYLDWQLQATLMGNPYSFDLPVDNPGQHTLSAIAYSNTGVTRCYAESLTISNAAPGATLYPQNLAFGNQNVGVVSAAQSVTLSNSGNAPLAVTGVAVGGTNAADFQVSANTCGSSLAAGSSCAVSITFTPAASGTRTGAVAFTDAAGSQSVSLSGTGMLATATLQQISAGTDGSAWALDNSSTIYVFRDQAFQITAGTLTQVVATQGTAWGLNAAGQIFEWNSTLSTWTLMPGNLSKIAVGFDGDVWGLNSANQIYHFIQQTTTWLQIPGNLAEIFVGFDGAVWGVNGGDQVYRFNPGRQVFEQAASGPTRLSVGVDGDTWGLDIAGSIYHFNQLSQQWDHISGRLSQISVGSGTNVWGCDFSGTAYKYDAQAQSWAAIGGTFAQISAGANGAVWGIDYLGHAQQILGGSANQALYQLGGSLVQISAGTDGEVWGLNSGGQIFQFDLVTQTWNYVEGQLKQIAVGTNGNVWGINPSHSIFHYNPASRGWDYIPGSLVQIAVGANGDVWGINEIGSVFKYDTAAEGWQLIPGSLAQLSVGADGAVWGVNSGGQVYRWDPIRKIWIHIPGVLSRIAVGSSNNVCGINPQGEVYCYDATHQSWIDTSRNLVGIAVGFDGTIWGTDRLHQLWKMASLPAGWNEIPGSASQIAVGSDAVVWTISASGSIYHFK